eukprot:TRINITY_DN4679_c0_g2_i1.p2 TRINITY_DN4679_c0_g2~~TRINITY_DN4679_c0_g2_i1.p2  ORF type:complete len:364 (-),score=97.75 TRINITY_DN4679_c0_g2_i1:180-1181(-)
MTSWDGGWGGGWDSWSSGGGGWNSQDWNSSRPKGGGNDGHSGKGGKGGKGKGKGGGKGKSRRNDEADAAAAGPPASMDLTADDIKRLRLMDKKVRFCPDPATQGGAFTATYEKSLPAEMGNFGSLNAGDAKFVVGGKTINGQFAADLSKTTKSGQPDKYKALHSAMFADCQEAQVLMPAAAKLIEADPNVKASYLMVVKPGERIGACFIDVFREDCQPHGYAKNVAMVYTNGPQRRECSSDADFLLTVRAMAANVSAACAAYNALKVDPSLDSVRVCLVSGGAFAGRVPKGHVAHAIILGLADNFQEECSPIFEFSFDGDIFKGTWDTLCGTA